MDAEELVRILRQGECPRVEFKQDFPKQVDEVAKHMSAFANSGGGVVLMGVADDGALPGILEPDKVMNRLAGLGQSLSPSPEIEIDAFHFTKSVTIVYARIFQSSDPCYYNDRFYRRVGSSSRLCSGEQLTRILSNHPSREAQHDLERAARFRKMIDDGYTVEQLSRMEKKRPTYIRDLLLLLNMPEMAKRSFLSGEISKHVGVLIGTIPDEKRRVEFFKEVLTGGQHGKPMSVSQAKRLKARRYMQDLKVAPFPLDDMTLDPEWGKTCTKDSCEYWNGNTPEQRQGKRPNICLYPPHYAKLVRLNEAREFAKARNPTG